MTIIVIDTCIFLDENDYFFKKPKLKLLRYIPDNKIVIPEVIFEEIASNIKKKIISYNDTVLNQNKKLNDIGINSEYRYNSYDETQINQIIDDLKSDLDVFYQENEIELYELPSNITVQDVLNRALNRQKPFKEDGGDAGLKDYLIWETIINIIQAYPEKNIIFITNNHKDFCQDGIIHPHLINDLTNKSLNSELIKIANFDEHIKNIVKPEDKFVQGIVNRFLEDKIPIEEYANSESDFTSYMENNLDNISGTLDMRTDMWGYEIVLDEYYSTKLIEGSINSYPDLKCDDMFISFEVEQDFHASIEGWGGVGIGECKLQLKYNLIFDKKDEIVYSINVDETFYIVEGLDDLYDKECAYHTKLTWD